MATPPQERDRTMMRTGTRLLALGVVLAAAGIALIVPLEGTASGIGVALASLASVPIVAGLGLLLTALVSRRSRAGKPWA
jgi:hypothetical protein